MARAGPREDRWMVPPTWWPTPAKRPTLARSGGRRVDGGSGSPRWVRTAGQAPTSAAATVWHPLPRSPPAAALAHTSSLNPTAEGGGGGERGRRRPRGTCADAGAQTPVGIARKPAAQQPRGEGGGCQLGDPPPSPATPARDLWLSRGSGGWRPAGSNSVTARPPRGTQRVVG